MDKATLVLLQTLTPRELEVLSWILEDKSNWEIGRIIGCSEQTAKTHRRNLYRKLSVHSPMGALHRLTDFRVEEVLAAVLPPRFAQQDVT